MNVNVIGALRKALVPLWIIWGVVGLTLLMSTVSLDQAEATSSKQVTGTWYVDTVGAPFKPHGIIFHADGTLVLTNPDAAEAINSSSAGMGEWAGTKRGARGRFFEVNADKISNQFTTILVVTFDVTVNGSTFNGPATATYYDGDRNVVAGPFPATLKGQRFTVDGPIPDPVP